jgi:hypothetical protein
MAVENEPISGPIGALLLPHVKDEAYRSPLSSPRRLPFSLMQRRRY